jgi:Toprim-like
MPRSLSDRVARLERNHVTSRKKRTTIAWLRDVNVIDLLENFDIANINQATADEVLFSCPFPGHSRGDERPSAYMNDGTKNHELTTLWKCHGCGRSGNAVGFVAEQMNVSRQKARIWLKEHYAPGYSAPRYGSIAREFEERRKEQQAPPEDSIVPTLEPETLRRFDVDWGHYAEEYRDEPDVAYMLDRGFTPAMLDEWGIGYDADTRRLTIPVCDADNNLVGFKARAWEPDARPKYLILGDRRRLRGYGFSPYDKSKIVFGLNVTGECDRLVLVEGEIDVMSLWVMGIPAICTGGASMSDAQALLIRQYCDELVVFLDSNTAGHNATWGHVKSDGDETPGIVERLEPHLRIRIVRHHRYDPNDYLVRGERDRAKHLIDNAKASFWYDPSKQRRNHV